MKCGEKNRLVYNLFPLSIRMTYLRSWTLMKRFYHLYQKSFHPHLVLRNLPLRCGWRVQFTNHKMAADPACSQGPDLIWYEKPNDDSHHVFGFPLLQFFHSWWSHSRSLSEDYTVCPISTLRHFCEWLWNIKYCIWVYTLASFVKVFNFLPRVKWGEWFHSYVWASRCLAWQQLANKQDIITCCNKWGSSWKTLWPFEAKLTTIYCFWYQLI